MLGFLGETCRSKNPQKSIVLPWQNVYFPWFHPRFLPFSPSKSPALVVPRGADAPRPLGPALVLGALGAGCAPALGREKTQLELRGSAGALGPTGVRNVWMAMMIICFYDGIYMMVYVSICFIYIYIIWWYNAPTNGWYIPMFPESNPLKSSTRLTHLEVSWVMGVPPVIIQV